MAKKIANLEDFIRKLKMLGYRDSITFEELRYQIAVEFGYSKYHFENTYNALTRFNMIREIYPGIFQFVTKKTKELAEKQAKAEAEKLLKDMKNAKIEKQ